MTALAIRLIKTKEKSCTIASRHYPPARSNFANPSFDVSSDPTTRNYAGRAAAVTSKTFIYALQRFAKKNLYQ